MLLSHRVACAWALALGLAVAADAWAQPVPADAGARESTTAHDTRLDRLPQTADGMQVDPADARPRFFHDMFTGMGESIRHIPRKNSLYWLGAGAGLALAVHSEDREINDKLKGSAFADTAFRPGKYIGSLPVLFAAATTTYVIGRTNDHPKARHLGMDMIQATLLSEVFTEAIKVTVRRKRPLHDDGTRNSGFAFPSGHATMSFAVATVLQQHLGWKAAVPTYAIAAYVATSRLHDDRHYASDVIVGAANGIVIGRSITWHGRHFYASALPVPGGVGVGVRVGSTGD
jgi:membrane-associated phospholipid phosphatase